METHPSYHDISSFSAKYPRAAGSLFLAFNDIVYSQQWADVEVLDLEPCSRAAIRGRRPNAESTLNVVPCALSELISLGWLDIAFVSLDNPPEVYLAITSEDSSIVYYIIRRGIAKPPL